MSGLFSRFGRAAALVLLFTVPGRADFGDATAGLVAREGLIETYVDAAKARVLVAFDAPAPDGTLGRYIHAAYLTGGLGSNPVGLDRSVPTGSQIIAFRRAGDRVVVVVENSDFQASGTMAEKRAVETSFASSIIWSTPIVKVEDGTGRVLVDLSSFLARDAVGVAARLDAMGEGSYKVDKDRSYVDTNAAFTFPINMEFDAYVTFAGTKPGREVRGTTPVPEAITLLAHTTLMKLPEAGYEVRHSDERAGIIDVSHIDMSAGLTEDTVVRLARRFRLQKDADGKVIKPIIFYIDNAAPEPIRSALQEGVNWWAEAFDAAGFPGGFRAEILPEGVHPLDARYNVVNWVHRATRGWSYGAALHDPRTGETLRGIVLLGSLRVRQDIKIFEALAGTAKTGTGAADDPVEVALARIRQLGAHEVGHAIGFAHNMAASTVEGGDSVMDYPAPDVRLSDDGTLDFSHAYGVGIGEWDKWTVNFLYGEYAGEEKAAQAALIADADAKGLLYVMDPDSRPISSGHTRGALWDTGTDPLMSLANTMKVRALALSRFGEANLRKGESATALQSKFVPLYLYHRYQIEAVGKTLGGSYFTYRHEGDGRGLPVAADWATQSRALDLLLDTVGPVALDIPEGALTALSPLGFAEGDPQFARETFKGGARPAFDPMAAAAVAADLSFDVMLHPARLARVADQGLSLDGHPGLAGVLGTITDRVMTTPRGESARASGLRQVAADRLAAHLLDLTEAEDTPLTVRTAARAALLDVRKRAARYTGGMKAFGDMLSARIDDALARARTPAVKPPKGPDVPPGSPIGMGVMESCWHCAPESF